MSDPRPPAEGAMLDEALVLRMAQAMHAGSCERCDLHIAWDDLADDGQAEWLAHAEDAIAAMPALSTAAAGEAGLREALAACLTLIDDMSRFVGNMSLRDYALFNDAPIQARAALSAAPAVGGCSSPAWFDLRGKAPTEKPGSYVNVRDTSATTYRWLAYKPDGARQMRRPGRWQRATEHGWENAPLPGQGEWQVNPKLGADGKPLPAPPPEAQK